MPLSRDPSLPEGLSDLGELIDQEQQRDRALGKLEEEARIHCKKLAPLVFNRLSRLIDHDLLFTLEQDLVLPKIQEVSRETLYRTSPRLPRDATSTWIVEILTEEVWIEISRRRPTIN